MGSLSPAHWAIVLAVLVLLFGASKLPQLARSLGQSARVFRAETRGMAEDAEAAKRDKPTSEQQLTSGDSTPHDRRVATRSGHQSSSTKQ